jgi:tRNA G18 (ribose-2'-O)-methylase SpoU
MEESPFRHIKYNVITPLQGKDPAELKMISSALALPVHLMLFNLDGNMNIAMSIRTAAVLGCSDVWIVGKRRWDARPEVGSKNYIRVHKVPTEEITPDFFKERGLQPYILEQGGTPLEDTRFPQASTKAPLCFIMGPEAVGFDPAFLRQMAAVPRITISQYGILRSLNVSVAASIVLYEYMRQYRAARKDL